MNSRVLVLAAALYAATSAHALSTADIVFGTPSPVQLVSLTGAFEPQAPPESGIIENGQALQYSIPYTIMVSDQGLSAIETRSGPDFDRSGFFANSLTTELHGSHGVFLPATGFEVAIVNIYTFPTCFPCSGIFTFGASSTAPTLVATKADDQPDSRTVSGVLTLTAGLQASDSPQLVRLAQIRTQVYTLSSPIPEPATAALCVAGLLLLGLRGRLRKRR